MLVPWDVYSLQSFLSQTMPLPRHPTQENMPLISERCWSRESTVSYTHLVYKRQVEVLPFTNPGDQKTALLAGELDMTGTTMVTAITAAEKGEPIRIVAGLCNKCSALVVKKDSGIKKPEDLKGKHIAYVPGTMHLSLIHIYRQNVAVKERADNRISYLRVIGSASLRLAL